MKTKPNIVIVMTDQHRADHSAREGFPLDTTPYLDHLASQGVCFARATGSWTSTCREEHSSTT